MIVPSVVLAFFVRLNEWHLPFTSQGPFEPLKAIVGAYLLALPIFMLLGVYRPIFRYAGKRSFEGLLGAGLAYAAAYFCVFTLWSVQGVPRTVGIIQPFVFFIFMIMARAWIRVALLYALDTGDRIRSIPRVLIYGAGVSGRQCAVAITSRREMDVRGFVDDSRELQGASIDGIRVFGPQHLRKLVDRYAIDEILLAIPSASRQRRNEILRSLRDLHVNVRTLPDLMDEVLNRLPTGSVRDLAIEDLLNREPVEPDSGAMAAHATGQVILVTGAGGSIGSELCRQLHALKPASLLLLDNSEFGLYAIHRELDLLAAAHFSGADPSEPHPTKLVALLGSVADRARMDEVLGHWNPSIVYHAAAYKHVPLVEHNAIQGIQNNALGTLSVARLCVKHQVKNFVLISTDKAVRPTNIMGATKRLAEMVLQALAADQSITRFSMVRFGNVLGSSGSVVPVFRQQILSGGPVTVTDERITRFFMTIPEAAQLVIQAGAMASGGEVFVLDMGNPVRIVDLARNMIELSGLTVKDKNNPNGDMEIAFVGLRPGEKLYEELLIEDSPLATAHPRIRKANEGFLPLDVLSDKLSTLSSALDDRDACRARAILREIVPEFVPEARIVDHVAVHLAARDAAADQARAAL